MVGWHHRLNGHESEQTLEDGDGQRSLVCCSSRGPRVRGNRATKQEQQDNLESGTEKGCIRLKEKLTNKKSALKEGMILQYSCLENPHRQKSLVDFMESQRVGHD